jgi:hypothetical protein
MEPRPQFIADIAVADPIAAYGIILGIPRVPVAFNITASFSSFSLDQNPVPAALEETVAQRTWIDNIQYDLQVPNLFSGQVFKTLSDTMFRYCPGVSVQMVVHSGPKYFVTPDFVPLNNFVNLMASRWPAGWPLFKQQSIITYFQLTQVPSGVNSPPYNITLTLNGWQFLDHNVDEISVDVAACKLRELGFWVPPSVECP